MKDLTGQRFNRLTVVGFSHRDRKAYFWNCRCDCGNLRTVDANHLKRGNTKSCGCLQREHISTLAEKTLTKHGHSPSGNETDTYHIWAGVKSRCLNPKNEKFHAYGGRGIKVCERWLVFSNFLQDMGERPTTKHSIHRKDNDGDYCPGNCSWALKLEQANNTRTNHFLTFKGKRLTMAQWARITGIRYENIKNRINNLGWSVQQALTTP